MSAARSNSCRGCSGGIHVSSWRRSLCSRDTADSVRDSASCISLTDTSGTPRRIAGCCSARRSTRRSRAMSTSSSISSTRSCLPTACRSFARKGMTISVHRSDTAPLYGISPARAWAMAAFPCGAWRAARDSRALLRRAPCRSRFGKSWRRMKMPVLAGLPVSRSLSSMCHP